MNQNTGRTELYELTRPIRVVGPCLQKSGLPIAFESLGALWERYGQTVRGHERGAAQPVVEYGVSLNTVPDYITGYGATADAEACEGWLVFEIPAGRYVRDTFSADTFEELTGEALAKRDVPAWAEQNGIRIDPTFGAEVYPPQAFSGERREMYTLTPVAKEAQA